MADLATIVFGEDYDGEVLQGLDSLSRNPQIREFLANALDESPEAAVAAANAVVEAPQPKRTRKRQRVEDPLDAIEQTPTFDSSDDEGGEEGITLGDIPWPNYLPLQWTDRFPPKISLELRPLKRNPQYSSIDATSDVYRPAPAGQEAPKNERVKVVPQPLPNYDAPEVVKLVPTQVPKVDPKHYGINLQNWEDSIVYDQGVSTLLENGDKMQSPLLGGFQPAPFVNDKRNQLVDKINWEDDLIIDGSSEEEEAEAQSTKVDDEENSKQENAQEPEVEEKTVNRLSKMVIDVNDARLWLNEMITEPVLTEAPFLEDRIRQTMNAPEPTKRFHGASRIAERGRPFNPSMLSRDRYYEDATMNQVPMLRQALGSQSVPHSLPAVRLYRPYYKIHLTQFELRRYHRLPLKISPGLSITFSARKKAELEPGTKMRGRNIKAKNLTVKDLDSKFVLFEYSEEYPPLLQKLGMACIIHWYFRKDANNPKLKPPSRLPGPGALFELEPEDASPFLGFGDVAPGELIPAIYNNLFRATLHHHTCRSTDFLVVRHLYKGVAKVHLRNLNSHFVVGQTLPLVEVPAPHSRRVIDLIRKRLQHLVFQMCRYKQKMLALDPRTVRFSTIRQFFPATQEAQLKIRLKEFCDWGKKTDLYTLRHAIAIPTEDELRALITPEMVCVYESMLVGQQMLQDAGYGSHTTASQDTFDLYPDSAEKTEMQSAPWNITMNFVRTTQEGKGSLQLYGPGDPTGKAQEGFSFFKGQLRDLVAANDGVKMTVAAQQKLYREAINNIFRKQKRSLDRQDSPDVSDDEEEEEEQDERKGRILIIQRRYRTEAGDEWRTEIIRDERVISVYMKRRKALEESDESIASSHAQASTTTSGHFINPLHDPISKEKQRLMDEISKLKKSKQRRLQREAAKNKQLQKLQTSLNQNYYQQQRRPTQVLEGEEILVEDV